MRPSHVIGFARNVLRWGLPQRSLLFGPLSLGDDLLCTAVLHEARKRGQPFTMMTDRPELFAENSDPFRILPIDDYFVAGLRRLGARVIQPYYVQHDPADPTRDCIPDRHIIAEMCALAGITGTVALRPYLHLTAAERTAGRIFPRQITIHSSGLAAAVPYDAKEWGAGNFNAVARLLASHTKLVQLGSSKDPLLPVDSDLRGKTTLREAAAILAASDAFVGLEGFLTHLVRAVDCPAAVVLGGRARPEIFGYAANRNFSVFPECAPCGRRTNCPHEMKCMTAIAPEAVANATLDLAAQTGRELSTETVTII